jgi:peptidoglycan hydrolase CwlO-like protein
METLVDITVKVGNDRKDYIGIPSNLSIHQCGDVVVSESRDAMISEVDGLLQSSKSIIESIDYHKKMITACESILKQLNPIYAKEQERDGMIDDLKNEVEFLRKEISKMT